MVCQRYVGSYIVIPSIRHVVAVGRHDCADAVTNGGVVIADATLFLHIIEKY